VPTYASACSNAAAYRSACSCWGILPVTTTAAVPQSVVTVTATATATTTVVENVCNAASAPCNFNAPGACCSRTCCADFINGGSPKCGVGYIDCSNVQPRRKRDGPGGDGPRVAVLLSDGSVSVQ